MDRVLSESEKALASAPALSIRQPWADLVLRQLKRVELRSWPTSYRGWIWLHTGAKPDENALQSVKTKEFFLGGFIGAFYIRDVVLLDEDRWEQWRSSHLDPGPYTPNFFGWVIGPTLRLQDPIPAAGNLRLFDVEPQLAEKMLEAPLIEVNPKSLQG